MRSMSLNISVFCLFLVGSLSAQDRLSTVPSGMPNLLHQRSFSIPFEVRSDGADPPKEIELLFSSDRGVRWFSAKRVPVDAKKFDFTAPSDGEYWFVFRTITLSGVIRAANQSGPQLRVVVDTTLPDLSTSATADSLRPDSMVPAIAPTVTTIPANNSAPQPLREASTVPITPPKPPRTQTRSETVKKTPVVDEPTVSPNKSQQPPTLFLPSGEAVSLLPPAETEKNKRLTFDPLLAEMSRFYETPLENSIPDSNSPAPRPAVPESRLANPEPQTPNPELGVISGVSLADVQRQPRVVVRWVAGDESWRSATAEVLRGASPQGPWLPIATNLPNNGEYWWFVTSEDVKPFYVSVRLRAPSGASTTDATRSPIRLEPAMFNSATATPVR